MRTASIYVMNQLAGYLTESDSSTYTFTYLDGYSGIPVSLTMPTSQHQHTFSTFPPFFEGLLPEGFQLEALFRKYKVDRTDLFEQLILCGADTVGAVTIQREVEP